MIGLRNKSVNVDRLLLLSSLKKNLDLYRTQYQEALTDYKTRLQIELNEMSELIDGLTPTDKKFETLNIKFNYPVNHEQDYINIMEMLELSVDEVINLDEDSFRAYIKNQWQWTESFSNLFDTNKNFISGKLH